MRKSILVATLAATLALGTLQAQAADAASVRVVVSNDELVFERGVPYYKVTREPVYVTYKETTPTYYRVVDKTTYKGTAAVPPPWAPAYGWRMREGKLLYGHYDAKGVWHWD